MTVINFIVYYGPFLNSFFKQYNMCIKIILLGIQLIMLNINTVKFYFLIMYMVFHKYIQGKCIYLFLSDISSRFLYKKILIITMLAGENDEFKMYEKHEM